MHKFEIPYQMLYRFSPAKYGYHTTETNPYQNIWEFEVVGQFGLRRPIWPKYVAAAEDYTCLFYTGPPLFYYRNQEPQ
jgi:hypothetical protein